MGFGPADDRRRRRDPRRHQREGDRRDRRAPVHRPPAAADVRPRRADPPDQPRRLPGDRRRGRPAARAPDRRRAIVEEVLASGLRGRGGAGFPTGIKWKTVANTPADQKYIVCNADEGDSAHLRRPHGDGRRSLRADRRHGDRRPRGRARRRATSTSAASIRTRSASSTRRSSTAAPIIAPFRCEVRVGAGAYVCGEETSLLNSLEGKRAEVRAKPPLPAIEGLFGKPTVVNNVLTLAAIPHILEEGGSSIYDKLGVARSKGTMPIQLAGNIRHGGLFEIAFGITLRELIYDIGGGTESGRPVKAVQVGGPLGAYIHPDQFDITLRLRGIHRGRRADRPRRHHRVRRHRRHGRDGALRDGVLRRRKLRQVHPVPDRRGARGRADRPHPRRRAPGRRGREPAGDAQRAQAAAACPSRRSRC